MATRVVEGKKPYTGGKAIEVTDDKVINLRLRDENNLIIYDSGDDEIYVDLQLPDEITPTDAFPVGVTTGRVIVDNGWDAAGTIICAKTTSGDNIKILYEDNGKLYIDNGTGTFKQIYLKGEVDALLLSLRNYIDTELAKKQDKLIAGENITIAADGKTISATTPPMSRFLSLWNCATGQPISFPADIPFEYITGDHYMVEIISSATPAVNLRPDGTEYDGTASSTPETANVAVGDVYIYDGTVWLLQKNTEPEVSFSAIAGQPTDNTNLANALSAKQDVLTAGTGISISSNVISNTAITTVDSALSNSSTNPVQNKVITNSLDEKQDELTAGNNITITPVIESDMKGPCPSGFHIPLLSEWQSVINIWTALGGGSSDGTNFGIALKLPFAGYRSMGTSNVSNQGTKGCYKCPQVQGWGYQLGLVIQASSIDPSQYEGQPDGCSIRAFKNTPVTPDSSWTKLYGTSIESGGIFWDSTSGLISLSSNGSTWITMADKNVGATTVWNNGDTLSEANCGGYFQWGNNYMFPWTGNVTTSTTKPSIEGYGPGNYYSSSTFIKTSQMWRGTPSNTNLRGGATQGTFQDGTVISASAPVTSVNGQTGVVTVDEFTPGGTATTGYVVTKTAGGYEWQAPTGGIQLAPNTELNIKYHRYGSQASYDSLNQYYTDTANDTAYFTI